MRVWGLLLTGAALTGCALQVPEVIVAGSPEPSATAPPTSYPSLGPSPSPSVEPSDAVSPAPTLEPPPQRTVVPFAPLVLPPEELGEFPTPIPTLDCQEYVNTVTASLRRTIGTTGNNAAANDLRAHLGQMEAQAALDCRDLNVRTDAGNLRLELAIIEKQRRNDELALRLAAFNELNGAEVVAQDGTYLGFIGALTAPDSIFNSLGAHGGRIGIESIWNTIGEYGSSFGIYSAFNPLASKPPIISKGGVSLYYLTTNPIISPRISPETLVQVMIGQ